MTKESAASPRRARMFREPGPSPLARTSPVSGALASPTPAKLRSRSCCARCCCPCCISTRAKLAYAFAILLFLGLLGLMGYLLFPRIPTLGINSGAPIGSQDMQSAGALPPPLTINATHISLLLPYTVNISVNSSNYIPWTVSPVTADVLYVNPKAKPSMAKPWIGSGGLQTATIYGGGETVLSIPFNVSYTVPLKGIRYDPVLTDMTLRCGANSPLTLLVSVSLGIPLVTSLTGILPKIDKSITVPCPLLPQDLATISALATQDGGEPDGGSG